MAAAFILLMAGTWVAGEYLFLQYLTKIATPDADVDRVCVMVVFWPITLILAFAIALLSAPARVAVRNRRR